MEGTTTTHPQTHVHRRTRACVCLCEVRWKREPCVGVCIDSTARRMPLCESKKKRATENTSKTGMQPVVVVTVTVTVMMTVRGEGEGEGEGAEGALADEERKESRRGWWVGMGQKGGGGEGTCEAAHASLSLGCGNEPQSELGA